MHGAGFDHTIFRPFLDQLSDRYTLIFYDQRGSGSSPRPPDLGTITHESLSIDADQLREALGFDSWIVMGHSAGGFLALEYALRFPERTSGLILVNATATGTPDPDVVQRATTRGTEEQVGVLLNAFSGPIESDDRLREVAPIVLPMYFHTCDARLLAQVFGEVRYSAAAFNRALFELLPSADVLSHLPDISIPTLAIAGEDDWLYPPSVSIAPIVERMPNAKGITFAHCGHFPFVEHQERFCDVVSNWIDSEPGGC